MGHWECQRGTVQGQSGTTTLLGMTRSGRYQREVSQGRLALQVNVGHGGGDAAWLPTPWKRKDGLAGEGLRSPEVVTSSLWDSPDIQRVWSPRALDLYLPQWEECLSNMAVVLERA